MQQQTENAPCNTPLKRAEAVKRFAGELGFDACASAAADEVDPENHLGEWLARGYHAGMQWMADTQELRRDVRRRLPGARSVVAVARNYYAPRPEGGEGKVARYAWGRDYHRTLFKPLRRLAAFLNEMEAGAESYTCIDSGPVMEKAWAEKAGLGWIGKNSLVLRRDLGSWFFLGIVATTVELAPDSPSADYCGSCTACIDACPTDAIVEPRLIDSNRCISYHTIENRGEIPSEVAGKLGDWAFGCDICQEVCPWNRRPVITTETDFHPRPGHAQLDLARIEAMDEESYRAEFAGTPLMRPKLPALQRNVTLVRAQPQHKEHEGPQRIAPLCDP